MSRPARPYRASYEGKFTTVHYDYPTKDMRADEAASVSRANWGKPRLTTVTSRKPVKRGEPVCWVNVYSAGQPVNCSMYYNKEVADGIIYPKRLHCIPVYLPGEGAERRSGSGPLVALEECDKLRAEVERLTNLAKDWETTARVRADERDTARAEVATVKEAHEAEILRRTSALRAEVDHMHDQVKATNADADMLRAEVARLTAELAILRKVAAAAWCVYEPGAKLELALMAYTAKFGKPQEPAK